MQGTDRQERGKSQFNHVVFCDRITFIFDSESGPCNIRAQISLGKTKIRGALIIDPSCHPNPHEQIYPMGSCFVGQFSKRALRLTPEAKEASIDRGCGCVYLVLMFYAYVDDWLKS